MTRKMKKIASVVLAAVMLFTSFAFNSFAADAAIGEEAMSVGLSLSAESAQPGDIITVTISISNNYNATAVRWPVLYSKDFFEVVDGSLTSPIDSAVVAAGSTTVTDNDGFVPAAYADTHSAYTIQWRSNPSAEGVMGAFNSNVAVQCFTFQLRVLDTAAGSGTVLIPADSESFYDSAITDVNEIILDNLYEAENLEVTVSDPATVSLAVAADPELVATEGYSVKTMQFDGDDNVYLVGFDLEAVFDNGEDFKNQFTVNNGTYELSSDSLATGTVVTVYDAQGNEYASYTIIVFGDSTGDGSIDFNDALNVAYFISGDIESNLESMAKYYAADLIVESEASAYIDFNDILQLDYFISGDLESASLNQQHKN